MNEIIKEIIHISKHYEPKSLEAITLKLMEEVGELAEAVNHKLGNLPHKTMKEPLEGEVADIINCAIAVLVKAYPELSEEQIYDMLRFQSVKKTNKWVEVISARAA
jgi:NTP pyrophosphatase (non-canonical NTP hydrolase)